MGKLKKIIMMMDEAGLEYPVDVKVIMKEVENA